MAAILASLFQVKTTDGILHTPSLSDPELWWVTGRQPGEGESLSGGASFAHWRLSFRLSEATAEGVTFTVPGAAGVGDGRTATAQVSVEPCRACSSRCTYLDVDPANCGSCEVRLSTSASATISCVSSKPTCSAPSLSACPNPGQELVCIDLSSDRANCGACGNRVDSAACVAGKPTCSAGEALEKRVFGWECVDIVSNSSACGGLGHACVAVAPMNALKNCSQGKCYGLVDYTLTNTAQRVDCIARCASFGLVCDDMLEGHGGIQLSSGIATSRYACAANVTASLQDNVTAACVCKER